MAIISTRLLESDKGERSRSKGCQAPGQLDLTDIPLTGTKCSVHIRRPIWFSILWLDSHIVVEEIGGVWKTYSIILKKIHCSLLNSLFSFADDGVMLHLHVVEKIKSWVFFCLTVCQNWCRCSSQISSLCHEEVNNTVAIPAERNHLHNLYESGICPVGWFCQTLTATGVI